MCIHPSSPEYSEVIDEMADFTQTIAAGNAPARIWMQRATHLRLIGEVSGAIRDFNRAMTRRAELTTEQIAFIHNWRGVCYRRCHETVLAIADLEQAVDLAPDKGIYWSCLGIARFYNNDFELAIVAFNRAIELFPENERSWEYRALSQQALGHHELALADFQHRFTIDVPIEPDLYAHSGYSNLVLERYEAVIADCDNAQRVDKDDHCGHSYRLRGHAHFALGNLAAALGDFSRAIAVLPNLGELYFWRGQIYRAMGDYEAAADEFVEYAKRRSNTHTAQPQLSTITLAPLGQAAEVFSAQPALA